MQIFNDKVRLKGKTLGIRESIDDKWTEVLLSEEDLGRFRWMILSDSSVIFTAHSKEWDVFMGPYIDGSMTGYSIQVISLVSRNVVTVQQPFTAGVDVKRVKEDLRELL